MSKTSLIFEWQPDNSRENLQLGVIIFSNNDETNSNNSKSTRIYSLQINDNLFILYANDPPVHGWIALQAYMLLQEKYGANSAIVKKFSEYLPAMSG